MCVGGMVRFRRRRGCGRRSDTAAELVQKELRAQAAQRSFLRVFDAILSRILATVGDPAPQMRKSALKSLSSVILTDSQVLLDVRFRRGVRACGFRGAHGLLVAGWLGWHCRTE